MESDYTVYVDEAGDLGIERGTKWFVLSAVIVEKEKELPIREKISKIKADINVHEIHIRKIPGQSRIMCKHHKGANRAKTQRERREAVPFGVILAAKTPHVKNPPAQSGIRSAKYTPNWAWIALQSCRRPVHFLVMSIIAR